MKTVKDILNICNAAISYDYKNIGFIDELNQAHKCIINTFHETIPVCRILITLSILDFVFLKTNDNDTEKVIDNIHDLRAKILYMIRFEKLFKDDVDKVMN